MVQLNPLLHRRKNYFAPRMAVALSFLLLAAALMAFYWPWLTESASFYVFDFTYGWHANMEYAAQQWRQGKIMLWNPYVMCGVSQLALTSPSIFYPPDWLLAFVSFNRGMACLFVFNQFMAALGTFLLIAACGLGALPALLGAVAYAVSGYFFSAQVAYSYQATATWMPWCAWALLKIDGRPRSMSAPPAVWHRQACLFAALAAIFVALMINAAFFELSAPLLQIFLLGSITLALLPPQTHRQIRIFFYRGSAILAGTLLAMPMILPLVQWEPLSPRASGLPLAEIMRWSATWYDLAMLFLPQPLGDLYNSSNPFELLPSINPTPLLSSVFLGPIVITLSVRGLLCLKKQWRALILLILGGVVLAALGINTPVGPALIGNLHMPFRYPVKLLYFVMAITAGLSAIGMQSVLQRTHRNGNGVALYCWLLLAMVGLWLSMPSGATAFVSFVGGDRVLALHAARVLCNSILFTVVSAILAILLMEASDAGKMNSRLCCSLLLISATVVYFAHAFSFSAHPGPADFFTRPVPLAETIHRLAPRYPGSFVRFAAMYHDPARVMDKSESEQWTVNNYQHVRQMLVCPNNQEFGIGNIVCRTPGELDALYRCMMHARNEWEQQENGAAFEHFCQMSGAPIAVTQALRVSFNRVVGSVPILNPLRFHLEEVNAKENFRVYTLTHPFARAYFARKVLWGKPHAAVVKTMAENHTFPLDQITILEHNAENELAQKVAVTDGEYAASRVGFLQDEPDMVRLQVETPTPNYLVLCDQNYPGWQANMDGQPTRIWTANASFRAVLVPTGRHIVEFRFAPPVLSIALALAFLGFVYIITLMFMAFRRH